MSMAVFFYLKTKEFDFKNQNFDFFFNLTNSKTLTFCSSHHQKWQRCRTNDTMTIYLTFFTKILFRRQNIPVFTFFFFTQRIILTNFDLTLKCWPNLTFFWLVKKKNCPTDEGSRGIGTWEPSNVFLELEHWKHYNSLPRVYDRNCTGDVNKLDK